MSGTSARFHSDGNRRKGLADLELKSASMGRCLMNEEPGTKTTCIQSPSVAVFQAWTARPALGTIEMICVSFLPVSDTARPSLTDEIWSETHTMTAQLESTASLSQAQFSNSLFSSERRTMRSTSNWAVPRSVVQKRRLPPANGSFHHIED